MTIRILTGDCREILKTLPDASMHCVVTSPPYWGLRDYNVDGQIGLEQSPDAYIAEMVAVFREVKRVLRDDATVWLNLGDSYNNFRSQKGPGQAVHGRDELRGKPDPLSGGRGWDGLKEKDLMMMPARVALALQADGWWLRSDIIWAKKNCMPESVNDRPTTAHEHIFLLTKKPRYFYDAVAIEEEAEFADSGRESKVRGEFLGKGASKPGREPFRAIRQTRNKRSVWWMATQPFTGSHFAVFPDELAMTCIQAGTSERGCCAACGAPWVRQIEKTGHVNQREAARCANNTPTKTDSTGWAPTTRATDRWLPSCSCNASVVPATVLDPFSGAGTTALVADRLGRNAIGIELNPSYCEMARRRIEGDAGMFADCTT